MVAQTRQTLSIFMTKHFTFDSDQQTLYEVVAPSDEWPFPNQTAVV